MSPPAVTESEGSARRAAGGRAPRLLAISDGRAAPSGPDGRFEDWLRLLGEAGAGADPWIAVQLRERQLDDRRLWQLTRRAREILPAGLRIVVNRRLDLALAAGADGVHLPSSGLPVAALRRRFGPEVLIGCSTHRPEEVEAAREAGANYVTFGPVWPTPSKPGWDDVPGLEGLEEAAALGLPVLALGGVENLERLGQVLAAGAHGAAGIRAFRQPDLLPALVVRVAGSEGSPVPKPSETAGGEP